MDFSGFGYGLFVVHATCGGFVRFFGIPSGYDVGCRKTNQTSFPNISVFGVED